MQKEKIIVLCLNWNGYWLLKRMLPSLQTNLDKLKIENEIYIRDNGSKDKSVEWLEKQNVKMLKVNHNTDSFSVGVNSLFKLATPADNDILLLINNDIVFNDHESLKNMLDTMKRTKAAIVGAKLLYKNGKISHNGIIFSKRYGNMPWHHREGQAPSGFDLWDREFQAVTAACCLVRAANFRKAGMLNTKLFWAFEDVDLNLEISINQKRKIVCCGNTNITHITSASLRKNPVNKLMLAQNVKVFKEKWLGKYKIDHDQYLKDKNYKVL